jgi:hypothetical protein
MIFLIFPFFLKSFDGKGLEPRLKRSDYPGFVFLLRILKVYGVTPSRIPGAALAPREMP